MVLFLIVIIIGRNIGAARVAKNTPMFVCAAQARTDRKAGQRHTRADGTDMRDRAEDHLPIISMGIQRETEGLKLVMTQAIRIDVK